MRISDWSSDVCSSDLVNAPQPKGGNMSESILAPGAVLALWTLIMLVWVAATRFPAMAKAGIDVKAAPPGGRGAALETVLPPNVNWKSPNSTHLLDQPTLSYPLIVFLLRSGGTLASHRGEHWDHS